MEGYMIHLIKQNSIYSLVTSWASNWGKKIATIVIKMTKFPMFRAIRRSQNIISIQNYIQTEIHQ
jgi:hypothetical protein